MKIVQHNNENINENINAVCPIPWEQQPVREYWCLKKRKFFRWAILARSKYVTKLLAVWITSLLLALFVFALRSPYRTLNNSELLIGAIVAELVVFLVLIRLYTAWHYLYSRLIHREIDYKILAIKETGIYQKSELLLARDVLIARFQVKPILKRIKQSMVSLAVIISSNFLILFLTTTY